MRCALKKEPLRAMADRMTNRKLGRLSIEHRHDDVLELPVQ